MPKVYKILFTEQQLGIIHDALIYYRGEREEAANEGIEFELEEVGELEALVDLLAPGEFEKWAS